MARHNIKVFKRSASDERCRDDGAAALEFALTLPLLIMLIIGLFSIGHGLVVRYMLSSAAYDAARTCTLSRNPTAGCAQAIITQRFGSAQTWCNGIVVNVTNGPQPGFTAVNTMDVRATCNYRGVFAPAVMQEHGITLTSINARSAMPY